VGLQQNGSRSGHDGSGSGLISKQGKRKRVYSKVAEAASFKKVEALHA